MALKGKKLHLNDIQGIRGFVMVYNGLATFAITYRELTLHRSTYWTNVSCAYVFFVYINKKVH
jgi:hypothetical protein